MNKKPIITHDAVHAVSAKLPALAGEIITGAIALLLIAAPASAQTPDADLDAFITQSMVQGGHPGLAALIIKHGAVVWSGNYGLAQVQPAVAVTDDTLFMLGSVSKTVTAAAILQLWEQGRFGLDDDINDYLPFRVVNPHFPDVPITFRMLLTHSSSIQDNSWMCLGSHMYSDGDSPISLRDFVEGRLVPGGAYYASSYMVAPPGTVFDYSNVGFTLVGYLVESISGTPFDAYTQQNIFDPLGMDSTGWHLADLGSASIAMPYRCNNNSSDGKSAFVAHPFGQYGYPDYPDGSLRTSARQLAQFLGAIMNGGELDGVRILKASTVQAMLTPVGPPRPDLGGGWMSIRFGTGWMSATDGEDWYWGHGGADRGVSTMMFFRPSDGTGVIVLANGNSDGVA
ncbi:MAG TPA: serine hydrolase domain-containing protein, partial [Candidatus Methylomirabilis sp.]|nr:serine hydrolase domain-containing protein [Candidatus Methylomirabilis sp.]